MSLLFGFPSGVKKRQYFFQAIFLNVFSSTHLILYIFLSTFSAIAYFPLSTLEYFSFALPPAPRLHPLPHGCASHMITSYRPYSQLLACAIYTAFTPNIISMCACRRRSLLLQYLSGVPKRVSSTGIGRPDGLEVPSIAAKS